MSAATTIKNPFLVPEHKQDGAKKWLQRTLHKTTSRNPLDLVRPRTAPASGAAPLVLEPFPVELQRPISSGRPWSRNPVQTTLAPVEQSHVERDVNAWLRANESPSSPTTPLMGGLSYWHAPGSDAGISQHIQYAVPITPLQGDRPATDHGGHVRSFYRRAKKVQVRMPSLLRSVTQLSASRKEKTQKLNSMSDEHIPPSTLDAPPDHTSETGLRPTSGYTGHRPNTRSLSTGGGRASNGESIGNASDAPTYFTGPPPPSYRSRAHSIDTMSSFGCVDGLNPAQRQASKEQAALRKHGMRVTLKKLQQKIKSHAHR